MQNFVMLFLAVRTAIGRLEKLKCDPVLQADRTLVTNDDTLHGDTKGKACRILWFR